ncbi:MAG: fatty acid desaturase, partial [Polyangiaceae bacterium]
RVKEGGGQPDLRTPRGWWFVHLLTALLAAATFVAIAGAIAGASWAEALLVLWVLPNTLRHGAIVTMSANSHYFKIERSVLVEQNQIIDHPLFWPLQLFCFNFGATHVVHHFFVRQPFWRRTLIFRRVRPTLLRHGVPLNDLGTFARANRRAGAT